MKAGSQPPKAWRKTALLARLSGGDRRSIGEANAVVQEVLARPNLVSVLLRGMWSPDPVLAMRSADAAEKVSLQKPALLEPFKTELLGLLQETAQSELRWHLCLMIPRVPLSAAESRRASQSSRACLDDRSSIVRTCALQALADLARQNPAMREEVVELLQSALRSGTAAMKARARKLLKQTDFSPK